MTPETHEPENLGVLSTDELQLITHLRAGHGLKAPPTLGRRLDKLPAPYQALHCPVQLQRAGNTGDAQSGIAPLRPDELTSSTIIALSNIAD